MGAILQSLGRTVAAGVVLLVILLLAVSSAKYDHAWGAFFMRYLHVLSGVMWIGLLWYFNFVQIPSMPKIPDEQKPAVGKVIAPTALFWFRWAALATVVTGALLAWMNGYLLQALSLQRPFTAIGIGAWLGLIMAFNVWFIIWPNQKKALGIVTVTPEEKPKAARLAMLTSRINTALSIPMLFCMVAQQNNGL
ncbi:MAG TPA: urate hydroxylase PuuD [Burkholderiaceae bacterium]|nr:urate hydroxylase PuuD [Burkholderiaceae bacterium]